VTLTARRLPAMATGEAVPLPPPPASPGGGVLQPDEPQGPTTLALLDLPALGDDPPSGPMLLIAAAGASAGWRKAALLASIDDGASWQPVGQTAPAAVMGQALGILPPGSSLLRDAISTLDVELLNDTMALAGSDGTEATATANLALVGDELIQFAAAEQTAPRRWRLSGLLRGRRGTEWAMAGHAAGERFVLVDPATLFAWAPPASLVGGTVRIAASGVGDAAPAEAAILFQARALRPPAPIAIRAAMQADGSLRIGWTRRSRAGWTWRDDTDAPLGEQAERYRLTASRSGGPALTIDTDTPEAMLSAADLAALGEGALSLSVAQSGTFAASLPPAVILVPLGD